MTPALSFYDYLVVGFYFAFMAVIGVVCRRFIGNTSDYFRGGGKMLWLMAGSSAFMVSFSAWTFTGAASKAYEDGPLIMVLFFANAVGFLCNYLFFAPRFRQMRAVTALEAVRTRFGKGNEQFFTWVQIPLGILYAGIWLNGLAVFIAAAFGFDLRGTIIVTGAVVVLMAVTGGSWAVAAGDFMQMLILMPVTVVAAVLAVARVGGWGRFLERLPHHHLHWTEGARGEILALWVVAIFIKQFISTNNMLEASRYLNVKDSRQARKAALLGMVLFVVGPLAWFIPPMAASITHPDLAAVFPRLAKPSEGAFVATALDTMPAGMVGLLLSGIFAATMSSMDAGLNRNAGFFVKNFYHVVLRPRAVAPAPRGGGGTAAGQQRGHAADGRDGHPRGAVVQHLAGHDPVQPHAPVRRPDRPALLHAAHLGHPDQTRPRVVGLDDCPRRVRHFPGGPPVPHARPGGSPGRLDQPPSHAA